MNLKQQIGWVAAIAAAMLAAATPAGAFDRGGGYRDGRLIGTSGSDAVAYFRANELSTLVQSAGPAAIDYFRANERATMASTVPTSAVSYVDGGERGRPVADASLVTQSVPTVTSGFDWGDAAVGASSALLLALLVGGSLILVRHSRGHELAR